MDSIIPGIDKARFIKEGDKKTSVMNTSKTQTKMINDFNELINNVIAYEVTTISFQ